MKNWITSLAATMALALMFATSAQADGLIARTNSTQIAEGDTFQLVLTADGSGEAAPDLAPLQQDFEVLGTSQSSQIQVINGRRSQSVSWIVTLSPRAKGPLTIPALTAGTLSSTPLTVEVVDAATLPKSQGVGGIEISAEIDQGSHYVFQEIPLTVRIETVLPLQEAQLVAPTGDFELTQTGQDHVSQVQRQGQPTTVIERTYLLRPQHEGTLNIAPFTLRGAVRDPSAQQSPFADFDFGSSMMPNMMRRSPFGSMFNAGKPFVARSDAVTINVSANPATSGSDWFLPAKAVEIKAEWDPANPQFREGEAVTRRISLFALGARAEQLPDIAFDEPDGARIYLDDTTTNMVQTDEGTVARRDYILSVVPQHGGQITLPEVSVSWLDTTDDQSKTAVLPALAITVEGSAPPPTLVPDAPASKLQVSAENPGVSPLIFAGALAALVVCVAAFWFLRRIQRTTNTHRTEERAMTKTLKRLAAQRDHKAFYKTLLKLRSVSTSFDRTALDTALKALEDDAFASLPKRSAPDLKLLLNDVLNARRKSWHVLKHANSKTALPPLYPSHAA
ncbi:BatD family protein [Halovulum sp. GXIMD14793]